MTDSISPLLERANQLIQLQRYDDALKHLKDVLSQDPNQIEALALYAICQAELNNLDEAVRGIQTCISQQPDNDYFLYLYSLFLFKQEKLKEAEKYICNAISFQPNVADYFGLLSLIHLSKKDWQDALDNANKGLEIDSENLTCLNARSTALFKLDKKEEGYSTIKEALLQDPENPATHTNIGWAMLQHGDHNKALEHFREALKLDPNYAYAKAGLVEGLKARYWFYRMFLKYAFWLNSMKAKGQWIVILGLFFGVRILRGLAAMNEALSMVITPVIYLYFAFAISTWIIEPLSNLFLRLNIYGRFALTEKEIQSSTYVGISLAVGLAGGLAYLINPDFLFVMILIYGVSMMIPLASMFNPVKEKSQKILISYTVVLGLIGLSAIGQQAIMHEAGLLSTIYLFGLIAYQWFANAIMIR
jgi:tetratricopeptide (TPR) repeat protein